MLRNLKFRRWIVVSIALLGLFLAIGILSVSYSASVALFSGILLGLLVKKYCFKLARCTQLSKKSLTSQCKVFFVIFLLILLFISTFWFSPRINFSPSKLSPIRSESYQINIYSKDINLVNFQVEEIVKLDKKFISQNILEISSTIMKIKSYLKNLKIDKDVFTQSDFEERIKERNLEKNFLYNLLSNPKIKGNGVIKSDKKGFIVKELCILPLNLKNSNCKNLEQIENFDLQTKSNFYFPDDLKSVINFFDFPLGTFYEAYNSENIKTSTYSNTEIVTWILPDIKRGVRFTYLPPPYNYLRGFFTPFLGLAYTNKWIIVIVGGVISVIYTSALKPIINVRNIAKAESKLMSESSKYNLSNAKFGGGFSGDEGTTIGGSLNDYSSNIDYSSKQNLAEAAAEIQQLLQQLEQTNPTTTTSEKMNVVAKAVDEIEKNPTLKARVIGALKSGGKEALKEAVDHPLVNILMASIEGWQEA